MNRADRMDDETIGRIAAALLSQYPDAPIAVIATDGRFCDPPPELDLGGRPLVDGITYLDVVRPIDRPGVITAWGNARTIGVSRVSVQLIDRPGEARTLHYVDLRHERGVFLGLLAEAEVGDDSPRASEAILLRPRISHMEKGELGTIIEIDDAAVRMFGFERDESVGRRSLDFVHADDQERAIDSWLEMLSVPGRTTRWRGRYWRADGECMWVETTNFNRLDDEAHPHVLSELVDISEEMAAHEALRSNEEFLRRLTEALPVGVVEFDAGGLAMYANARIVGLLGCDIADLDELRRLVRAEDVLTFDTAVDVARSDEHGTDVEVQVGVGAAITGAFTMRPSGHGGLIMCLADVTERARLRRELEHLATYDELTGCQNRASTMRHLTAALRDDQEQGQATAAVFVDLDDFKLVNDRYGHAVGDQLLQEAAARLDRCTRSSADVVGRFGGDEFLVVFPGLRTEADLGALIERVEVTLAGAAQLDGVLMPLCASVGGAVARPGMSLEQLVVAADSAMYRVKRRHHARAAG